MASRKAARSSLGVLVSAASLVAATALHADELALKRVLLSAVAAEVAKSVHQACQRIPFMMADCVGHRRDTQPPSNERTVVQRLIACFPPGATGKFWRE
jgi:hypothetical protein